MSGGRWSMTVYARHGSGGATARAGGTPTAYLYGVLFAVKDSIDVAGMPTTAGCPALPTRRSVGTWWSDEEAGAILVGKTSLDQFATLVGTRSPYGAPNALQPPIARLQLRFGGSSGAWLVSFALGTDTAGSGRCQPGW